MDWIILSTISMSDLIVLDLNNLYLKSSWSPVRLKFLNLILLCKESIRKNFRLFSATTRGDSRRFVCEVWKQYKPRSNKIVIDIYDDVDNNFLVFLISNHFILKFFSYSELVKLNLPRSHTYQRKDVIQSQITYDLYWWSQNLYTDRWID